MVSSEHFDSKNVPYQHLDLEVYHLKVVYYYYTNACILIINIIIIAIVFLAHGEVYDLPVPSKHFDLNLWPYQHLDVAFGDMCRSVFRRYIIQRFSY